jgi:hypothetical protein
MRYLLTYDFMESLRVTNQWMGSSARAMCSYPQLGLFANPMIQMTAAWGEVTERTFARMVAKPDWGIYSIPADDGRDHTVSIETVVPRPFGDLIRFNVQGRAPTGRKVLLVAPHVRPLRDAPALHGAQPAARLRRLHHRLAQRARHSRQRGQVRYRGLHPLPRRFPARDGARHPCHRRLPARAAGAGRHRLPGRGRPRRPAAHPDADRRSDRPRRRRHRRHRFRTPRHDGPAREVTSCSASASNTRARAAWSIPACSSCRPSWR